jgi:hypothetical protein
MSNPKLTLAGQGATDYIGQAKSFYHQYELFNAFPKTVVVGPAIMLFKQDDIKIIMQIYNYALFSSNNTSQTYYSLFTAATPSNWNIAGGLLPSLPTFYPISPNSVTPWPLGIAVPLYNEIQSYLTGQSTPLQTITFNNPILSYTSPLQALVWEGFKQYYNTVTENQWFLMTYFLTGGGININDTAINAKICLVSLSQTVLYELTPDATASTMLVVAPFAGSSFNLPGIFFRRLIVSDTQTNMVIYYHNTSTYSGTLYLIAESSNTLTVEALPIPALPVGSRTNPPTTTKGTPTAGSLYLDNMFDIFTSEKSQYYYVVRMAINTATDWNMGFSSYYDPTGADTYIFPGMSLIVDQRKKSDYSLVQSFTLNPSSIDTVLQGFVATIPLAGGITNNRVEACGCINDTGTFASPYLPIMTAFVFQQGFVLIDSQGNEYPIVTGISLSQNFYNGGTDANVFCQAILLWLTNSAPVGFPGYSWTGVNGVGLTITAAAPGVRFDANIGDMQIWEPGIGDSSNLLLAVKPPLTQNTWNTDTYSGASCRVRFSNDGARATNDAKTGYTPGDLFYIDNQLVFTMGGTVATPTPAATAVLAIMALINAGNTYSATNFGSYIDPLSSIQVYTFTLTRLDGQPNTVQLGYTSVWGYRLEQRILSVEIENSVPVVTLQALQHYETPLFMFDI